MTGWPREELVQTALIKLYAAWPRIHTSGAEDAYVRRTIVRAHLDERRRPWRRERIGLDGVDAAEPERLSLEDSDALLTALKGLPHEQRATVVLRYWCGLSVEETAGDLGVSAGTVKSQTAQAMAALRASLSTDDVTTIERRSRGDRDDRGRRPAAHAAGADGVRRRAAHALHGPRRPAPWPAPSAATASADGGRRRPGRGRGGDGGGVRPARGGRR